MSVEDLTRDGLSDQEELSSEKNDQPLHSEEANDGFGGVGTGGPDDELFMLFHNLKSFEGIYENNALLDQEVRRSVCWGSVWASPRFFSAS